MTKEELEAAPAFDRTPYVRTGAATDPATQPAPSTTDTAMQPAPTTPPADTAQAPAATDPAAPKADAATTAAIDKSTLTAVPATEISADKLKGTTVYGADDANLGEIGDVVLTGDKVDAVVIDVGGFLGVGEKPVAVGMDNLAFMADKDGNHYLYTTFTKAQLEAAPAYDAADILPKSAISQNTENDAVKSFFKDLPWERPVFRRGPLLPRLLRRPADARPA